VESLVLSLVMNPGLPEEQEFALAPGRTFTIGRTKDNAVSCVHKSLSRTHARVDFDGVKVKVTDLESKNGVFFDGKRVPHCELVEGDRFRCGDIAFLLGGADHRRSPIAPPNVQDRTAQTMPSPLALDCNLGRRPHVRPEPAVSVADDARYKDKLFLLVRASELCVNELDIDRVLDELVALAVQVLEVDRIVLLTRDADAGEMRPRVVKTFVAPNQYPYSARVVDWVVSHGSATSFADVSRDRTLPGDRSKDENVRGAMCVPINPGAGTIGVIYADSLSRGDGFPPDDLALLRALANLAAMALQNRTRHHTTVDR
jgi:adenylate cyclase